MTTVLSERMAIASGSTQLIMMYITYSNHSLGSFQQKRSVKYAYWISSSGSLLGSLVIIAEHHIPAHEDFLCKSLFSFVLCLYILTLFGSKAIFWLQFKHLSAMHVHNECAQRYVKYLPVWLAVCLFGCVVLVCGFLHADSHLDHDGCWTTFDHSSLYVAFFMIAFDVAHILVHARFLLGLIDELETLNNHPDLQDPTTRANLRSARESVALQCVCFLCAMLSCTVDAILIIARVNTADAMPIFIVDLTVAAISVWAMINDKLIIAKIKKVCRAWNRFATGVHTAIHTGTHAFDLAAYINSMSRTGAAEPESTEDTEVASTAVYATGADASNPMLHSEVAMEAGETNMSMTESVDEPVIIETNLMVLPVLESVEEADDDKEIVNGQPPTMEEMAKHIMISTASEEKEELYTEMAAKTISTASEEKEALYTEMATETISTASEGDTVLDDDDADGSRNGTITVSVAMMFKKVDGNEDDKTHGKSKKRAKAQHRDDDGKCDDEDKESEDDDADGTDYKSGDDEKDDADGHGTASVPFPMANTTTMRMRTTADDNDDGTTDEEATEKNVPKKNRRAHGTKRERVDGDEDDKMHGNGKDREKAPYRDDVASNSKCDDEYDDDADDTELEKTAEKQKKAADIQANTNTPQAKKHKHSD